MSSASSNNEKGDIHMVEDTNLRPRLRGSDITDKEWIKQEETLVYDAPIFDRGAKFYAAATPDEKRLDSSVNRKLDAIVLPFLSIGFLLAGIDKGNIGNAATTTFVKDANLNINDIGNAVSLLSITFVTLQPVSTVLGRRVGPKIWLPSIMLIWGALCMAHAAIKTRGTLIALRLLLGAAEAGYVPTCFYYMSTIYPKYSLGRRLGLFSGFYALAGAFSGVIAYGVFHIKSSTYHAWQLLFLIEGGITLLFALCMLFVLPRDVATAWFLNPAERAHAIHRMHLDLSEPEMTAAQSTGGVTRQNIVAAITDWKKIIVIIFNICATLPVSAFGTFLPLIVKGMGYSGLQANLMTVPPFAVGAVGLFCFVWSSDHFHERSLHTIAGMTLGLVGLIVMTTSQNPQLRFAFVHVCLAGCFVGGPLVVAWLANNSPDKGTRSIIIGMNGYSNLAGVVAGQLFKGQYAPTYKFPLTISMIIIAIGMVGFFCMRMVYMWTNRKRVEITSQWTEEEWKAEIASTERIGDQKLTFIYGL